MLPSILIRRLLLQALMGPQVIVKINPALGFLKKLPQRAIGPALGDSELENPHKPLGVAIVSGRPCPTHRAHEAFPKKRFVSAPLPTGCLDPNER